jgi:hypothetical protein
MGGFCHLYLFNQSVDWFVNQMIEMISGSVAIRFRAP